MFEIKQPVWRTEDSKKTFFYFSPGCLENFPTGRCGICWFINLCCRTVNILSLLFFLSSFAPFSPDILPPHLFSFLFQIDVPLSPIWILKFLAFTEISEIVDQKWQKQLFLKTSFAMYLFRLETSIKINVSVNHESYGKFLAKRHDARDFYRRNLL